MILSATELADLAIRSVSIGQMLVLAIAIARSDHTPINLSKLCTIVCLIAYLLLTAPIPDDFYGIARGPLLLLTDGLIYSIWLTAHYSFKKDFSFKQLSPIIKITTPIYGFWYSYFFIVNQGIGSFHDIHHALIIGIGCHIIFITLREYQDDLIGLRRQSRIFTTCSISLYIIVLAGVELAPEGIRHSTTFQLINATVVALGTLLYVTRYWQPLSTLTTGSPQSPPTSEGQAPLATNEPGKTSPLNEKLQSFIERKGYLQAGLTVADLARQLDCPEHRLRQFINQELGYRNFSDFLNRHRLPEAANLITQQALTAPGTKSTPILTIALSCGFNSIGPFNRAFKQHYAMTPTEFREQQAVSQQAPGATKRHTTH